MSKHDLHLAAKLGPQQFKETHTNTSAREKLEAAEEQRQICTMRAEELAEARRALLVKDGWLSDEELRRETLENQQDIEDFDILIAALRQQIADEEAAAQKAAAEAEAAADTERRAAQKQIREKAAVKLDKALVTVEAALKAWVESQSDLPVVQQNRRPFYLRAAVVKLAPDLARLLEVQRVPHSHQRPLAEVTL